MQGAHDVKSVRLAELHSQAVDFCKHGQPAILPPDLRPRYAVMACTLFF